MDDNEELRETIGMFLETLDMEVQTAKDGQEALDLLARNPVPDVILLDLMMPGMNGHAFVAARKRLPRVSAIPVIVMTAANQNAVIPGVDRILEKPIMPEELELEILALVRAKR